MDIQYSGAVDFSPLFNNLPSPQTTSPVKAQAQARAQSDMLRAQEELLAPTTQKVGLLAIENDTGQIVNIIA